MLILPALIACTVHASCQASAADIVYSEVAGIKGQSTETEWITEAILYASSQSGVDPLLITAIMEAESGFNINAVSNAGAIGLMQLMPATASNIGVDPYNPLENVLGGALHLKTLLDSFSGWGDYAVTDAVAAYNAGSGAVISNGGCPPYSETRNYVIRVHSIYVNMLYQMCCKAPAFRHGDIRHFA